MTLTNLIQSNMHDFKINQIRAFVSVVDLGGFHAAAKVLHKTQPAISQAVNSLENELGEYLFEKENKTHLTVFGQRFIEHARDFLDYHDNIRHIVFNEKMLHQSRVSIAILPSIAQSIMPSLIQSFQQKHPSIRLSIHDASNSQIIHLIRQKKVDFGICALNHLDNEFQHLPLFSDSFGIVCHQNHEILRELNISDKLNNELSWQDIYPLGAIKNGTWNILPYDIRHQLEKHSMMSVINMSSLNAMLAANIGMTVLPELAFSDPNNQLRFIKVTQMPQTRQLGLVTLKNQPLSPSANILHNDIQSYVIENKNHT